MTTHRLLPPDYNVPAAFQSVACFRSWRWIPAAHSGTTEAQNSTGRRSGQAGLLSGNRFGGETGGMNLTPKTCSTLSDDAASYSLAPNSCTLASRRRPEKMPTAHPTTSTIHSCQGCGQDGIPPACRAYSGQSSLLTSFFDLLRWLGRVGCERFPAGSPLLRGVQIGW